MQRQEIKKEIEKNNDKEISRGISINEKVKKIELYKDKALSHYEAVKEKLKSEKIKLHNEITDLARLRDDIEHQTKREREPLEKYEQKLTEKTDKLHIEQDELKQNKKEIKKIEKNIENKVKENTQVLSSIVEEIKTLNSLEDLKKAGEEFYKKSKKEISELKTKEDSRSKEIADGLYTERKKLIIEKSNITSQEIILQNKIENLDKKLAITTDQQARLNTLIEKYGKCR